MSEKSKPFTDSRPKVFIRTYGCQMNVHDSEKISGIFSESGYGLTESVNDADVVIINTCSVRHKAEHKVYTELGRLKSVKQNNPGLKIAVAGCIAQQKGSDLFQRFPHVDFVFGPGNIDNLQKWLNGGTYTKDASPQLGTRITALGDNPNYHTKTLPLKREGQVRAWVSIMYGCDNFCAYCVVPYTRGRERSRQSSDIYNEIETLASQGFKEVTLLGQNVNSYGKNLFEESSLAYRPASPNRGEQAGLRPEKIVDTTRVRDFPDLLKVIHEVSGIQRIRFITSHPRDLSEKLIETMRDLPKICEHMHLPVQAGSDKVLHLMNRGYSYKEYKKKINMLRSAIPDIAITTDIIAGFPGETDEDFECTVRALKEIEFDGIFAFKYSKRPDTKALSLQGHIDEKVKSQRLSKVLDLQEDITYKKNKALEGKVLEVLVEGVSETDKNRLTGRTKTNKIVNFYPVRKGDSNGVYGDDKLIGNLVKIRILNAKQHSLYGEVASRE